MRKFTKAAAMLCAAAMVIPSASVFAAEDGGASELTEVGTYPISEEPLEFTMFRTTNLGPDPVLPDAVDTVLEVELTE